MFSGLVSCERIVSAAADFAELRTCDNEFDHPADLVPARLQLCEHPGEKRLVRKLHAPAKGEAQQLAAELAFEVV